MLKKLRERWVEYALGLLLEWFWSTAVKQEQKQEAAMPAPGTHGLHLGLANNPHFSIKLPGGLGKLPVDVFEHVSKIVPHVVEGLKAGHAPQVIFEAIKSAVAPDALSLVESAVGIAFPMAGTILGLLIWMYENSVPMTQEEANAWMDRFGAGTQS